MATIISPEHFVGGQGNTDFFTGIGDLLTGIVEGKKRKAEQERFNAILNTLQGGSQGNVGGQGVPGAGNVTGAGGGSSVPLSSILGGTGSLLPAGQSSGQQGVQPGAGGGSTVQSILDRINIMQQGALSLRNPENQKLMVQLALNEIKKLDALRAGVSSAPKEPIVEVIKTMPDGSRVKTKARTSDVQNDPSLSFPPVKTEKDKIQRMDIAIAAARNVDRNNLLTRSNPQKAQEDASAVIEQLKQMGDMSLVETFMKTYGFGGSTGIDTGVQSTSSDTSGSFKDLDAAIEKVRKRMGK